ncbi:MAG: succinate dehydrogenase [Polyangiaceae bacterium]
MTGLVPTGLVMLVELWTHAKALDGAAAHAAAVRRIAAGPVLAALVVTPMVFHAGFGLWLALRSSYTVGRYPTSSNWDYTLQRVTGVLALGFIGLHVATYWWPLSQGTVAPEGAFEVLRASLSSARGGVPLLGLGYLLGFAACAYHFANGLRRFALRWGIAVSAPARRRASLVAVVLGLGVLGYGGRTLVYLATGSRFFGTPPDPDREAVACEVAPSSTTAASPPSTSTVPTAEAAP